MENADKALIGYKSLIASGLAFSLMSICVKEIDGRIPVAELIFARGLFSLLVTRFLIFKKNIYPWGKNKSLLILRGILGTGALFFIFKALSILPLASATIIQYTYPTFTAIFAYFLLKEKLGKEIILSVLIGWIGIIFLVQPTWIFNQIQPISSYGLFVAISGSILTSLAYICVRKLSSYEEPLVIIEYFPLVSLPLTIPFLIKDFILPTGYEWYLILGIGIFTQIGQMFITQGLKLIPASRAVSINYSQVIFSCIWGILLFKEELNSMLALGAICILISTLITISATKSTP